MMPRRNSREDVHIHIGLLNNLLNIPEGAEALRNVPLHIQSVRYSNSPLFALQLNSVQPNKIRCKEPLSSENSESLTEIRTTDRKEDSCVGNISSNSGNRLVLACSQSSLNLSSNGDEENAQCRALWQAQQTLSSMETKPLESNSSEKSLAEEDIAEDRSKMVPLSTSSSGSSTAEAYLPAITGSTDTFGVAHTLYMSRVKRAPNVISADYSKEPLSFSSRINNESHKPPNINDFFEKLKTQAQSSINEENLHLFLDNDHDATEFKALDNILKDEIRENISLKQIINIQKCKKVNNLKHQIIKNITKNNSTAPNLSLYQKPFPNPHEWMNEIKTNKLVMKQDVIEKDFSAEYLNERGTSPNNRQVENTDPLDQQDKMKAVSKNESKSQDLIAFGNREKQCASSKIVIDENNSPVLIKNLMSLHRQHNSLTGIRTSVSDPDLNSNSMMHYKALIRPDCSRDNTRAFPIISKVNSFGPLKPVKSEKQPKLLRLLKTKPQVSKLIITSNVLGESIGESDSEAPTRKKIKSQDLTGSFAKQYQAIHYKHSNIIITTSEESIKIDESNSPVRAPFISNEKMLSDRDSFQKLKEYFNYKNVRFSGINEMYIADPKKDDSAHVYSEIASEKNIGNYQMKCSNVLNKVVETESKDYFYLTDNNHTNLKKEVREDKGVSNIGTLKQTEQTGVNIQEKCNDEGEDEENSENQSSQITNDKNLLFTDKEIHQIEENISIKEKIIASMHPNKNECEVFSQETALTDKKILIKEGRVLNRNGLPASIYNKEGNPVTDLKGRVLKNNKRVPLIKINEEDTDNLELFDTDNIPIKSADFDPSKRPTITTLVKVTDQARNPAALYNNLGDPLTDEDGMLLHDSKGNILVTMDTKFFPLCCKTGMPIYLTNGTSWLSQRFKYIVTTQHKASMKKNIGTETESVTEVQKQYFNDKSFTKYNRLHKVQSLPQNDINLDKGNEYKHNNIIRQKRGYNMNISKNALCMDQDKIMAPTCHKHGLHGKCYSIQTPQRYTMEDYYQEQLAEKFKNGNGDVIRHDDTGRYPQSTWSESISSASKQKEKYFRYTPERPYCDQRYKCIQRPFTLQKVPTKDSLATYKEAEPIIEIVKAKNIQAWNVEANPIPSGNYFPQNDGYYDEDNESSYYNPIGTEDVFYENHYPLNLFYLERNKNISFPQNAPIDPDPQTMYEEYYHEDEPEKLYEGPTDANDSIDYNFKLGSPYLEQYMRNEYFYNHHSYY